MESFISVYNHYHDLIISWCGLNWTYKMSNRIKMLLEWIVGRMPVGIVMSDSGNPYNGQKGMPNIIHPPDNIIFAG